MVGTAGRKAATRRVDTVVAALPQVDTAAAAVVAVAISLVVTVQAEEPRTLRAATASEMSGPRFARARVIFSSTAFVHGRDSLPQIPRPIVVPG